MYLIIWLFFIYAFIGWCSEVAFSALNNGKFTNRGFLNGPVCPIYGFGVLFVLHFLEPFKENLLILFLGSIILTSALELVTGFLLEKLFNKTWWNYSNELFNIGGYICLKFSIMWGLACILVVEVIHPLILAFMDMIPDKIGFVLLLSFILAIIVDIIATVNSINKLNRKLEHIDEIALKIRSVSDDLGEKIANRTLLIKEKNEEFRYEYEEIKENTIDSFEEKFRESFTELDLRIKSRKIELDELKSKYDELLNKKIFGEKRILHAFPKMDTKKYRDVFQELKNRILNK